jgi:hypothetical protein
MALTLLEIYELHQDSGALLKRITAACGLMCRTILADPTSTPTAKAWANQAKEDPVGVARTVLRGVVTDPTIIALAAADLRDGSAPTDQQLMVLLQSILTTFVG